MDSGIEVQEAKDVQEIKPSFTWRFFGLQITLIGITAVLTVLGTLLVNRNSKERRQVEVSSTISQNLAAITEMTRPAYGGLLGNEDGRGPSAIPGRRSPPPRRIEVFLSSGPNRREPVQSLYRFDVTIKNTGEQGLEDFKVHFDTANSLTLVRLPDLTTTPAERVRIVRLETLEAKPQSQVLKLNLLNTNESIRISFFGYSEYVLLGDSTARPLVVQVEKKDWTQHDVSEIASDDNRIFSNVFRKRISEWTDGDIIVALFLVAITFYLFNSLVNAITISMQIFRRISLLRTRSSRQILPSPTLGSDSGAT